VDYGFPMVCQMVSHLLGDYLPDDLLVYLLVYDGQSHLCLLSRNLRNYSLTECLQS
jgi:hypothetical protein